MLLDYLSRLRLALRLVGALLAEAPKLAVPGEVVLAPPESMPGIEVRIDRALFVVRLFIRRVA